MLSFIQDAAQHVHNANLTETNYGLLSLAIFIVAYALVVTEDLVHLRKSKPVIMAAGLIWVLTALAFSDAHLGHLEEHIRHHVNDFGQLFLFLMVAMTYISAIAERNVFLKINAWLVSAGFGLRAVVSRRASSMRDSGLAPPSLIRRCARVRAASTNCGSFISTSA